MLMQSDSDSDGCKLVSVWSVSDCLARRRSLATPGNCCSCQNQHQLARLVATARLPQVAVFKPSIGGTWGLATCPMPLPGVITGHYGLGPVSRAGRNKPSGHLFYSALATYTIRLWPLTTEARVRLPRSCQPIPSRSFSIDLTLKKGPDFDLLLKRVGPHLQLFRC